MNKNTSRKAVEACRNAARKVMQNHEKFLQHDELLEKVYNTMLVYRKLESKKIEQNLIIRIERSFGCMKNECKEDDINLLKLEFKLRLKETLGYYGILRKEKFRNFKADLVAKLKTMKQRLWKKYGLRQKDSMLKRIETKVESKLAVMLDEYCITGGDHLNLARRMDEIMGVE